MSEFNKEEHIVGHFVTISGSIVIADGIHADSLPGSPSQRVILDLGKENTRIPVIVTQQHGHKFLLIPVDAAVALPASQVETVIIEDPIELPAEEPEGPQPK